MPSARSRNFTNLFLVALWAAGAMGGLNGLMQYAANAGPQGPHPSRFPLEARLPRSGALPDLYVFIHPNCSCSRATLSEVERLAAQTATRLAIHLIFYKPAAEKEDWVVGTTAWLRAQNIPGVSVQMDEGNSLGNTMGALTSGTSLLYSVSGDLVFAGGLTPSRGHEGETDGHRTILDFLRKPNRASSLVTKVFGCGLTKARTRLGSYFDL